MPTAHGCQPSRDVGSHAHLVGIAARGVVGAVADPAGALVDLCGERASGCAFGSGVERVMCA